MFLLLLAGCGGGSGSGKSGSLAVPPYAVYFHSFSADSTSPANGPGTTSGTGGTLVDIGGGAGSIHGGSLTFQPVHGDGYKSDYLELPQTSNYIRSSQTVRLRFVYHRSDTCDRGIKLLTQANHTTFYMPILSHDGSLYLYGITHQAVTWTAVGSGASQALADGTTYDLMGTATVDLQGLSNNNIPRVTVTAALYAVDSHGARSLTPQAIALSYTDMGASALLSGVGGITGNGPTTGAAFTATEFESDDDSLSNPPGQQFYMLTGTMGARNIAYELYVPAGTLPSGHERLIVYSHGFQSDVSQIQNQLRVYPTLAPLLPGLMQAGYLVISSAEDGNPWGNDASQQDIIDSVQVAASNFTITGVHLYGVSMGGLPTALTVLHSGKTLAGLPLLSAAFNSPVLDLQAAHDGTEGTVNFGQYIDLAYGGFVGYQSALPTHNPLSLIQSDPAAVTIPTRFYAASDDTVIPPGGHTTPFVAALASRAYEHEIVTLKGGHTPASSTDATALADLLAFFARAEHSF